MQAEIEELAEMEAVEAAARASGGPSTPEFVPGYRRLSITGGGEVNTEEGEFFTTVQGFPDPYGGMDPTQYVDPSMDPNEDPFTDPYGGMDPSQYTDPSMDPNEDPFTDPYGGLSLIHI